LIYDYRVKSQGFISGEVGNHENPCPNSAGYWFDRTEPEDVMEREMNGIAGVRSGAIFLKQSRVHWNAISH
jgi:Zn-finger nucleic acid-binding protein